MDFVSGLSGKVGLVTGAGSGIGRATAVALSEAGVRLVIVDINSAGLEETLELLSGDADAQVVDVSDAAQCERCVSKTVGLFGGLDILCNIAGIAKPAHLADISVSDWNTMLGVNLSGVFFLCQAAMPELLKTKGCIVNMASSAGLVGQAYNTSYCATKGGVVMLSKALAVEFAKQGVRVNAVCPGAVATPLLAGFTVPDDVDTDLLSKLFPLTDMAQPEEIAAAVMYLVSPSSRFITGEALAIDGGQTAC